jgi:hypothetical protein
MSYFCVSANSCAVPCQFDTKAFTGEAWKTAREEFYFKKYSDSATRRLRGEITIPRYSLMGADAGRGLCVPRILRHHGVSKGKMKKKIAAAVITPEIGRVKKIASDP